MAAKGVSNIQKESSEAHIRLEPIFDNLQKCYEKWSEKNRFMSSHKHYELFDSVIPHGKDALRCIFVLMRGGSGSFLYEIINKIAENEGLQLPEFPEDERGRIGKINERYIKWADDQIPPTVIELYWSSLIADEKATEFWSSVVIPSLETNYGGTYFSGSLSQAENYSKKARQLRQLVKDKLLAEKGQW